MSDSSELNWGFFFCILICSCISVGFSFGLIITLNRKKSSYAKIMRHIVMSESIFIFCYTISSYYPYFQNYTESLCLFLSKFSPVAYPECNMIYYLNKASYHACEAFSILLNVFICLETILILKNPIAINKGRIKIYFLLATFFGFLNFILDLILYRDEKSVFASRSIVIMNFIYFSLFAIVSFISFLYLMIRFCRGKSLLANLKNIFVIRHSCYVGAYFMLMLPMMLNGLLYDGKDVILPEGFVDTFTALLGFIMFLIRASETNFYVRLFGGQPKNKSNLDQTIVPGNDKEDVTDNFFDNDEPLTNIISRNMNLEFMCCILYGLTEIFTKPDRKKLSCDDLDLKNKTTSFEIGGLTNTTTLIDSEAINKKDYKRAQSHRIYYKKLFNDDVDFESFGVQLRAEPGENTHNYFSTVYHNSSTENDSMKELVNGVSQQDYNAKIVEYFPRVFGDLRSRDEVDTINLKMSFDPILNKERMTEIKEGEGKSGSFFFSTHDGRFLIKTITDAELNTMKGSFMKNYHEHITSHEDSLLARIYGVYSVVIRGVSQINFILMQNLMCIQKSNIKRIFDLKGSRVQRYTKNIEKCDNMKTLKDLDYLWMIDCDRGVKFIFNFY